MSQFSISGAVSGLDTATIINQLVAVDAQQQTLIQNRQTATQKASSTYASIISSLNSLSDQAAALAKTSAWVGTTATSSAASVTATTTGTQGGQLTFAVKSLAAAHALVSAGTVSSTHDVVAANPLTVTTSAGKTTTIDIGGGTLSEVVSAINKSDAGIKASAVLVGSNTYRLQVASTTTGSASSFTLDGITASGGMQILAQGTDAKITVGTNVATQYDITSATNTFSGVVPGLSFTVSALESAVTVDASVDGSKVADQVSSMVDAANKVLSTIDENSKWDATNKTGGPLFGESATERLRSALLSFVGSSGAPGVETTKDGQLTFSRDKFLAAFTADPDAVAAKFGVTSSNTLADGVTGTMSVSSSTSQTRAGTYAVSLTQAPQRDKWTVSLPADMSQLVGTTVNVGRGSTRLSLPITQTMTADDLATKLGAMSRSAGLGITAAVGADGDLTFTAGSYGAGGSFDADVLDADGGSTGRAVETTAGADIAGTIDGQFAKGSGDILQRTTGTGGAKGLALQIDTNYSGDIGSVTVKTGFAQGLVGLIASATDTETGYLSVAKAGDDELAKDLQAQYDSWTDRLAARRETLTKQFTAMETALQSLKSQLASLTSTTSSLSSSSSSSSSN